ncbi:acylphosphatase [Pontibacillus chungwhensis BH030062]|uniref:Acylphosphatase n=1 Tax=Pontibacillus chungwhensis BH030062 TaxID=1385513 RepID=A0A0A2UXP1_9BACI|nr:acylphosphatase [Pontibacillus chungwhensis]KGP93052.1 acylphosphatase [Pontibacillus chungwhensis BH030062]
MKRIHMIVSGRVQGVGFRFSAQQKAQECNVVGWVKNKSDGTVEIEAQGENDRIQSYSEAIKHGPSPYAKVSDITIEELEPTNKFQTFEIR